MAWLLLVGHKFFFMKSINELSVFEKILYFTFVIGWIIAPLIVNDVLESREIYLPSDLRRLGFIIWYAIGLAQTAWHYRNEPKK